MRRCASQNKIAMITDVPPSGQRDVVFHAAGNFRDKRGSAGVADLNLICGRQTCGGNFFYGVEPVGAFAVTVQVAARLDEDDSECAVGGGEQFLSLSKAGNSSSNAFGQASHAEWIVTRLRDFIRRQRGGELFARSGKNVGKVCFRKSGGELGKLFRRLVEPEIGDEFSGLFRMFEPGRLPVALATRFVARCKFSAMDLAAVRRNHDPACER